MAGVLLSLAYIGGLLAAGNPWGRWGLLMLFSTIALLSRRYRWGGLRSRLWLLAGGVGLLASFYLPLRQPHPAPTDISRFLTPDLPPLTCRGRVESMPRVTRSQRGQFWFQVDAIEGFPAAQGQPVTGKVYVTAPLLQTTGLYPGQTIALEGTLYRPAAATNPGGFDFRAYLAQEGAFAGMRAKEIQGLSDRHPPRWAWWRVRQRIIQAQVQSLGSPVGPLVSAMVLGSRAVDLPYSLKDSFTQTGLAHALAASGFQTSLILGVVLALTRRCSRQVQFAVGLLALGLFVALAGLQAAVLRAALMGMATLTALLLERKVKPLASLLLAAVLLLIYDPLWVFDLGFQFSFLATLGLLVTVPPLTQRLDWLPGAIAPLIAVPLAAFVWTIPLQLHAFGVVSPYSLLVNLLTTPLISILSLGGMASALLAVGLPAAGSAIAALLTYPAHGLIGLVAFFSQLPGNTVAVGQLPIVLMLALYALIGLVWLHPFWQRRWWLALLAGMMLVIVPPWQAQAHTTQLMVLATGPEPVLLIRDRGQVVLINSGGESTARMTLRPWLQQSGINRLTAALALNAALRQRQGWPVILASVPVAAFYDGVTGPPSWVDTQIRQQLQQQGSQHHWLTVKQPMQAGPVTVQVLQAQPPIVQFQWQGQRWLWLEKAPPVTLALPDVDVLWWSGQPLSGKVLAALRPQVAIASANQVDPETVDRLRKQQIRLLFTGRDGAIRWSPATGFTSTLEASEREP